MNNLKNLICTLRTGYEEDSSVEYWYSMQDGSVYVHGIYPLNTPNEETFTLQPAEALRQYILQTNSGYDDDGNGFYKWVKALDLRKPSVLMVIQAEGVPELSATPGVELIVADFESYEHDPENYIGGDPDTEIQDWEKEHPGATRLF